MASRRNHSAAADQSKATRQRLLRAAERLIIHEGVHALTIRRIAAESATNSALIGYHFGSAVGLLEALAELNLSSLLRHRKRLLDAALRQHPVTVDALLEAHLRPLWQQAAFCTGERALVVLDEIAARADEPLRRRIVSALASSLTPIADALHECLPQLDRQALLWRLRFLSGAALGMPPRAVGRRVRGRGRNATQAIAEAMRYRQLLDFARSALRPANRS